MTRTSPDPPYRYEDTPTLVTLKGNGWACLECAKDYLTQGSARECCGKKRSCEALWCGHATPDVHSRLCDSCSAALDVANYVACETGCWDGSALIINGEYEGDSDDALQLAADEGSLVEVYLTEPWTPGTFDARADIEHLFEGFEDWETHSPQILDEIETFVNERLPKVVPGARMGTKVRPEFKQLTEQYPTLRILGAFPKAPRD